MKPYWFEPNLNKNVFFILLCFGFILIIYYDVPSRLLPCIKVLGALKMPLLCLHVYFLTPRPRHYRYMLCPGFKRINRIDAGQAGGLVKGSQK